MFLSKIKNIGGSRKITCVADFQKLKTEPLVDQNSYLPRETRCNPGVPEV